jgi:hypothetical protein
MQCSGSSGSVINWPHPNLNPYYFIKDWKKFQKKLKTDMKK